MSDREVCRYCHQTVRFACHSMTDRLACLTEVVEPALVSIAITRVELNGPDGDPWDEFGFERLGRDEDPCPGDVVAIISEELAELMETWQDNARTLQNTLAPLFEAGFEEEDGMSDIEADADTLRSAGMGTDEDYGYFGGDE
ncbi:MAG: hypothetical protein E4H01_14805 [Lysobacterales bacterium]|nr:MAG: hypothetical protein E4H01_14805 [Xanthomonadales bacterium]